MFCIQLTEPTGNNKALGTQSSFEGSAVELESVHWNFNNCLTLSETTSALQLTPSQTNQLKDDHRVVGNL